MKREGKLLAWSIAISTGLSCLLLIGRVDHDFFSYYYAGKRISGGAAVYRDVYGNKGPWMYWFFAGLYAIFRDNYAAALIIGGGILDGVVIWLMWHLLDIWLGAKERDKRYKYRWAAIAGAALIYKGLTLDHFGGGIYSENIAMLWLLLSLLFWEKDKVFAAGAGFALAVMTRQTFLFFLPLYWLRRRGGRLLKPWAILAAGGAAAGAATIILLATKPGLQYVWDSVVKVNLQYALSAQGNYLYNLGTRLTMEPIVLTCIAMAAVTLTVVFKGKNYSPDEKHLLIWTGLISVIATWTGGYFYAHHFMQMSLFLGLCIGFLPRTKLARGAARLTVVTVILGLALGYSYIWMADIRGFVDPVNGLMQKPPEIADIKKAEYLVVLPYWAKLYFDYGKNAPDRFFDQYFLSTSFNPIALEENIDEHLKMDKEKLGKTVFVMAGRTDRADAGLISEYKQFFGAEFGLTKRYEYRQGKFLIEEYVPGDW